LNTSRLPRGFKPEETRNAWLRSGLGELNFWLQHIDEKTKRLRQEEQQGRLRYIEQAELIFTYSAFLNRLAQISLRKPDNLNIKNTLVPWLTEKTNWPEDVAYAFWNCIRNPVIHVGRTGVMADYGLKLNGIILKAGFRPSMLDQRPATEMPKPNGIGWFMIDWRGIANEITINFDFDGLREISEQVLNKVEVEVRNMSPEQLYELRKVSERLPFFYIIPEADSKSPQN
jgi:hypothetical protein